MKTIVNIITGQLLAKRLAVSAGLLLGLALSAGVVSAQPANDDFANAQIINGTTGSVAGTNTGATLDLLCEPNYLNTDDFASLDNSVWYSWTPSVSGVVSFDTFGSSFDTVLAVYTTPSDLCDPELTLVAGNDDYISLIVPQSRVTFNAVAGTTYYISVNGNQNPVSGSSDAGSLNLNWNEVVPSIPSGAFQFTTDSYTVSDSDGSLPTSAAMAQVPAWLGARVTVTRTAGSSGRVLVPYTVTGDSNQPNATASGTLIFDDYQMSADIPVTVSTVPSVVSGGANPVVYAPPNQITVSLGTPVLDTLESLDLIPPTVGITSEETVNVVSWRYPADPNDRAATLPYFNVEQSHFRVRRNQAQGYASIWVYPSTGGPFTVQYAFDHNVSLTSMGGQNHTYQLEAGSDYATPDVDFTDNSGGTLTWGNGDSSPKEIRIPILDNANAAFNEDIQVELFNPRAGSAILALGQVDTATVTILYDKQPAGAVDKTWNKDGFNDSNPAFLQYPGTQGGVSDSANGNGGTVYAVAEQPNGKAIIAGSFISYDSTPYKRIVRVLNNGYQDPTFLAPPNNGADDTIYAVALQPDGKVIIGGNFTSFNAANRYRIARLNTDGTVDMTFNPGSGVDAVVKSLVLETNGQIIIAGAFATVNGTNMNAVARLNADGSLDTTFNPGIGPNDSVNAVAVDSLGHVIIGGAFDHVSGVARGGVARLNVDGSLDTSFDPGIGTYNPATRSTDPVYALAVQPDGKILVGGSFANVEMISINGLTRFNPDGTLDTTFSTYGLNNGTYNPVTGVADHVNAITLQPDGAILIGGDFTTFNQTRRVGIARLFKDGSLDTSFMDTAYNQFAGIINHYHNPDAVNPSDYPQGNQRNAIRAIAIESGGNVIVGGNFLRVGGGSYAHAYPDPTTTHWAPTDGRYGIDNALEHGIYFNGRMDIHPRSNVARLIGGSTVGPGNMAFYYANRSVDKNGNTLDVAMIRTNGNLGTIGATFSSPLGAVGQQGIATENTDFAIGNPAPVWGTQWSSSWTLSQGFDGLSSDIYTAGNNAEEILTIYNNTNISGNLNANLALTAPASTLFALGGESIPLGAALGATQVCPLTIIDDNFPAGTFGFSTSAYTVNENATSATITIVRTNGTHGTVTLYCSTFNGTAFTQTNYIGVTNKALVFNDGDSSHTFTVPIIPSSVNQPDKTVNLAVFGITGGGKAGLTNAVLTIVNNVFGAGHIAFAFATNGVNETAGTASVVLNRLGSSQQTLDVTAIVGGGSAVNGVNYTSATNIVHWNSNDALPKSITIPIRHDGIFTSNLTVNIRLTNGIIAGVTPSPYVLGLSTITNSTIVITNVDFPGTVEFSSGIYSVKKYAGLAQIPIIRTGGSAGTVTVTNYTQNGTALDGISYTGQTNLLTFTNGQVSQFFNVPIATGSTSSLAWLNLGLTNAFAVSAPLPWNAQGSPSNAILNIIDTNPTNSGAVDETPGAPDISYSPLNGFNAAVFALALQSNNQLIVGGDFTMANGVYRQRLARLNDDGTLDSSFLFPANTFGANNSVRALAIQTDGRIIVGGYFSNFNNVKINGIIRLNYDGSQDSTFDTGSGADSPVLAVAQQTLVNGQAKVLVGGSFAHLNGVNANGFGRLDGDNINGRCGSPDPSFNAGGSGANNTVYALAVQSNGKIVIGGDFTQVNGVPVSHIARLNVDGSLDLTFTNAVINDSVRALAIQLDGQILAGGLFTSVNANTNYNHIVRLNGTDGSPDAGFTPGLGANNPVLSIAVQTDGHIVLGGTFTQASGVTRNRITRLNSNGTVDPTINFGVGADSFVSAIAIEESTISGYPTNVPDEKIIIGGGFTHYFGESHPNLARIYGGSVGGSGAFEFSQADYGVNENGTNIVITINRTGGTSGTNMDGSGDVFVTFATTNGTALAGVNYIGVLTNLNFPVGEVQTMVTIPVMDDHVITNDLTVDLSLTPIAPAAYGNQATAVLTISNVDSAISFSVANYQVNKYGSNVLNGVAPITIRRLGATYGTSTAVFNTSPGTATPGVDYLPATNVLVTFASGVTVQSVNIPIINGVPDGNTTVNLQLANVTGSALANPSNAVLTILDRTLSAGAFAYSAPNYTVSEGGGVGYTNVLITVLRTNGASGIVSVGYSTSDGTASAGVKYVATAGVLTYGDGEMSKSFVVPVINTATIEPTENFNLSLYNPTGGAGLDVQTNASVTILNTNIGIVFASATNTVLETQPYAIINVVRYNNTQGTATVNYATTNGTALAGVDYTASSGTLTFNDGVSQAAILVPLLRNTNATGDLQFTIGLANPSSAAQIGTPEVTTVILQDADTRLSFTTNSTTVFKNAGNAVIAVICSNTNAEPVSVNYATTNGTAVAGIDYTATTGTLTFSNGASIQTFSVPINNNSLINGNHTFDVSLSNPTGNGRLGSPTQQTVTILDSNSGLNLSSASYTVSKTSGMAVITVYRTDNTNVISSVDFVATNGTAVNGLNYYATNGTLVFTNGETVKNFGVPIIATTTVQPDLTVLVSLSNPVNGILINPSAATLTIRDNTGSFVIPAGSQLLSETNAGVPNGIIDPNESVQMLFALRDVAGLDVTNLFATLLATNGVINPSPSAQTYGHLTAYGHSVSKPFAFTAAGTNNQQISATFVLRDGTNLIGTAVFGYTLGKTSTVFSNTASIIINDNSAASPYPSIINVTGVGGDLIKATVTLNKLTHSNPRDVSALVVSPSGTNTLLMSHVGGDGYSATNLVLTFDDAAASLPFAGAITNGTYKPTSTNQPNAFP